MVNVKFKGMCVTASPPPSPPLPLSTSGSEMEHLSSVGCSCGSSPGPIVTVEELKISFVTKGEISCDFY